MSGRDPDASHPRMLQEWLAFGVFLLLLCVVLDVSRLLRGADLFFFDTVQPLLQPPASKKIVLVAIDDASVNALGGWPVPRSAYAELIDWLTDAGASTVGLDIAMPNAGRVDPGGDDRLAKAMTRNAKVVLPVLLVDTPAGTHVVPPVAPIREAAFAIARTDSYADVDGVSRSFYRVERFTGANSMHMSEALLRAAGSNPVRCEESPGSTRDGAGACRRYVPTGGEPSHASYSLIDVLRGRVAASIFNGAIVVVGPTSSTTDTHFVSTSGDRSPLTDVAFLADATDGMASGSLVDPVSDAGQLLLNLCVLPFLCAGLSVLGPRAGLLACVTLALATYAASLMLLAVAHVFYFPGAAAAMCIAAYPIWVWCRQGVALRYVSQQAESVMGELALACGPPIRLNALDSRQPRVVTQRCTVEREQDTALRFFSHDVRSPQAAILTLIEQRRHAPTDMPEARFIDLVSQYAESTLALVDQFLLLARAERRTLSLTTVDLAFLLHDTIDDFWPHATAKRTRVDLIAEPGILIDADAQMLRRAVGNLIDNAIKFGPENATVTVNACACERYQTVAIADQGIGIPADQIPNLFTEFTRIDAHSDRPGHGLGLAFVKSVIDALGGKILVESRVGQGSIFTLLLPKQSTAN
ncbi:CHASE2 and HATPase_c domain-containing protein [Paraburkholderia acidicola]|uniref:histidine kinase n=1 Tax=Paraburkholderia acidicola TaxID=1912599 RepID=A0ABV1LJE7_9BURK